MSSFSHQSLRMLAVAAAILVVGCSGSSNGSSRAKATNLPLAVIAKLDSGNYAYRSHEMETALAYYREAAKMAPNHAAPWFGMYLVARVTHDTALADSATAKVKKANGGFMPAFDPPPP